jgi:hypothetical protein
MKDDKIKFDYSRYHFDFSDKWYSLLDLRPESIELENLPCLIGDLIDKFVIIDDLYKPLALTYAFCPSALARKLPILILVGQSGSGKSTLAKTIAKIRNVEPLSSASTFASIRNILSATRYKQGDEFESNCILIWEDIDVKVFDEKPDIYRMLKTGYDRSTHIISISSPKPGENIRFETFCGKILSTTQPIWSFPRYNELDRRILIIPFKKYPELPRIIEDVDLYSFKGLTLLYDKFWANEDRCEHYVSTRKTIARRKIDGILTTEWTILVDLLTTGVSCNIWDNIKDSIEWAKEYLDVTRAIKNNQSSAFLELLKQFIEQEELLFSRFNKKQDEKIIISAESLKMEYTAWHKQGKIEIVPMPQNVIEYMNKLGYNLTVNGWEKINE